MERIFATQPDMGGLSGLSIGGETIPYPVGLRYSSLGDILNKGGINLILALAGFGLLLMIIRAGLTLLTSAGDAKKTEGGKQQLTYALVGFLIVLGAFWMVQILGAIFGLSTITKSIFP